MAAGMAAETHETREEIAVVVATGPTKIVVIDLTDLDQRAEAIKAAVAADTRAVATDRIVLIKIAETDLIDLDLRVEAAATKVAAVVDTKAAVEIVLIDLDPKVAEATRVAVVLDTKAAEEIVLIDLDPKAEATRVAEIVLIVETDPIVLDLRVAEADTRAAATGRIVPIRIAETDLFDLDLRVEAAATKVAAVVDIRVIAPIDLAQKAEAKAVVTDPIVLTRIVETDLIDLDQRAVEADTKVAAVVDTRAIAPIDLVQKAAVEAIRAAATDRIVLTRIAEIGPIDLDLRAVAADSKAAAMAPSHGRTETAAMTAPQPLVAVAMLHAEMDLLPASGPLLPIG
jgi:hypothetical protein